MHGTIEPIEAPIGAAVPSDPCPHQGQGNESLEHKAQVTMDGDSLDQNTGVIGSSAAGPQPELLTGTLDDKTNPPQEPLPLPSAFAAQANAAPFPPKPSSFQEQISKAEYSNPVPAAADIVVHGSDLPAACKPSGQTRTGTRLPPISNPSPRLDAEAPSSARRHHLLRHMLPPELSGENCVHHFGVTSVKDALQLVHTMSQRELQISFEKVYNVRSSSNNNNWLRKKLTEGEV